MFHRGFHFGRLLLLALILFGGMAVGRGLYRSGFEDGFVRGMAFSGADGATTGQSDAAVPPAFAGPGWRGGIGPVEGGFLRFGFLGFSLLGFGFLAFLAMLFMTGARRHHWAHHGPPGRHGHPGHHGHPRPHGRHGPGPEKQPEEYV